MASRDAHRSRRAGGWLSPGFGRSIARLAGALPHLPRSPLYSKRRKRIGLTRLARHECGDAGDQGHRDHHGGERQRITGSVFSQSASRPGKPLTKW